MKCTIACVGTSLGFRYRVTLWNGRVAYNGQRDYARYQDAERAAKATGATAKHEDEKPTKE
jgi:regulator of RNase E activity RraA